MTHICRLLSSISSLERTDKKLELSVYTVAFISSIFLSVLSGHCMLRGSLQT